jgi:uncharacterized protein (UPF0548 family)
VALDLFADPAAAARELAGLQARPLNFDPGAARPDSPKEAWRIDDHRQALPPEERGPPVPCGSWETARRLLADYDFVDPSIVRAAFRPDDPLAGRDMLLELRVWGLRFHVGVRVLEVTDARLTAGGREAQSWGWSYATLEGHFEVGRMDYEIRKWLDTGEVEFGIHAFSRVAPIPNPVVRLGFRLLGRRKQKQFARRACKRMRRLTEEALAGAPRPAPATRDGLVLRPAA